MCKPDACFDQLPAFADIQLVPAPAIFLPQKRMGPKIACDRFFSGWVKSE